MQKIPIIGKATPQKAIIIAALNAIFETVNLTGYEYSLEQDLSVSPVVIYITDQPDHLILDRIIAIRKSLALISREDFLGSSFYLPITTFDNLISDSFIPQVQNLREFLRLSHVSTPRLSGEESKIIELLATSGDKEPWKNLNMSQRTYYRRLARLRSLDGLPRSRQLIASFSPSQDS